MKEFECVGEVDVELLGTDQFRRQRESLADETDVREFRCGEPPRLARETGRRGAVFDQDIGNPSEAVPGVRQPQPQVIIFDPDQIPGFIKAPDGLPRGTSKHHG